MNANADSAVPQARDIGSFSAANIALKAPLRGALVIGARTDHELAGRLSQIHNEAATGRAPEPAPPRERDLHAPERVVIDFGDAAELAERSAKALKAITANQPAVWKALRAQGIFRGTGPAPKVAFLYTGQGSQYVNMLRKLRGAEPIVAETFAEADRVMTPILGKPLTDYVYVDKADPNAVAQAEDDLRQTAITQPAVLATDASMTRLLAAYGIEPDMAMGHSLGEYGALVASGGLPFEDALEAVAARGREMTRVSMSDNGKMAAVLAPLKEIERIIGEIDGYVVIANINSDRQSVIGGASKAVEQAIEKIQKAGFTAIALPVSHAFHTSIVSPASEPLRRVLQRLRLRAPRIPVVANVDGEFYPTGDNGTVVSKMLDILAQQVAAPVQFIKGLRTLYAAGARVFVETGPKKALHGFVEDVLGENGDVVSFFTNHPKLDDLVAFNQALCGLYAAGHGRGVADEKLELDTVTPKADNAPLRQADSPIDATHREPAAVGQTTVQPKAEPATPVNGDRYAELGRMFAEVLERGYKLYKGTPTEFAPVVITGAAIGLPGTERVFDDSNIERILRGDQLIRPIPLELRQDMLDKNIMRLVKTDNGGPVFESINNLNDVIKLAGRSGVVDLELDYGLSADRVACLDRTTMLAIAAGLDGMRDAGIPLVMRYKTTTKGTQLPDRWCLPDALRDDTGVIFASAFPGYDSFADEMARYYTDRSRREQLAGLERVRQQARTPELIQQLDKQISELRAAADEKPYVLDRRFLFRTLPMGHSQFAEYICARGPNTQINSACASTAQAIALAEDWIRAERCRRVIIISSDDVTTDNLMGWIGAGFLASGAAATDEAVEDAAIPFDRRRHGMVVGMGAAAIVVESAVAARERGIRPICEVLGSVTANSAYHGSRLDVQHISEVMENTIAQAEQRSGIRRDEIAPKMVFVSHETYTPARGGSASAEIFALRRVFRGHANDIVIANTKGLTGHAMATGMEDVVAIKALETGCVPPVVNFKEVDPELGELNLSKGGKYPVEYALHLGAGFGSQISMNLLRWVQSKDASRPNPNALGYASRIEDEKTWNEWLARIAGQPAAELEVVHRTLRVRDRAVTRIAAATQPPRPQAAEPTAVTPKADVQVMAAAAGIGVAAATAPVTAPVVERAPATPVVVASLPAEVIPAVTVVPSPETTIPATPQDSSVKERVLSLVAEKTGYPVDMLDLDLDLEADLGVDTVKQAEVMAAIRESYGIARDDSIRLRDFPTLSHVIRFVHERRPDLAEQKQVAISQSTERPAANPQTNTPPPTEKPTVLSFAVATATHTAADVKERVLALVVEKTGYPKDMLDLDLDLEADLGVDTVKQAELFAAIRELYNIPRDENVKLRDFPTLSHVIKFVFDRRPDLNAVSAQASQPEVTLGPHADIDRRTGTTDTVQPHVVDAAKTEASGDDVKETVLALVVEKTGYPKDMLDLDLDLEADLGVDTVKQAEMMAAIREHYNIPRDESVKLRDFPTLAHVIKFVYDRCPDLVVTTTSPEANLALAATEPPSAPKPTTQSVNPATAPAPVQDTGDETIEAIVLDIVAAKTGYPKDMLDLDLDLEADLGVDTVKQAEVFASVRATFNIERDENLKLRDFPTLKHVITFARERGGSSARKTNVDGAAHAVTDAAAPKPVVEQVAAPLVHTEQAHTPSEEEVKEKVLDIVAEKTGYPKDMLDLDLDLEADLGVDTVKQAEVFASVRAAFDIPRDENLRLRDFPTLNHVIRFACDRRAGITPRRDMAAVAEGQASAPPSVAVAEEHVVTPVVSQQTVTVTDEDVKQKVLDIVAEKTGYPKDMLDLDLDLEADLGVDTVKQAEVFASVRATFDIPRDENLKLRDFPTLAHVIKFARERSSGAPATTPVPAPAQQTEADTKATPVKAPDRLSLVPRLRKVRSFEAAEAIPRRVPVPVLRPPLQVCKETGVKLGEGSRVVVMPDEGGVAAALTDRLRQMGVEVLIMDRTLEPANVANVVEGWLAAGPVNGVYWLPGLDDEGSIASMTVKMWHDGVRIRLKLLYALMRSLYEQVATPGSFLISATRLGGQHGYDPDGATAPMGGAVAGFTKTYKRERPQAVVKIVDFEIGSGAFDLARLLADETLRDCGAVEIGYKNGVRWTIGLEEQPVSGDQPGMLLDENSVFVVTGAAGSIVSAITADLASASGGTFYLLDLVPEPDPNNSDIQRFVTDKDNLKHDLFKRIQDRGERATPALVEKELAGLERAHAALSAINAVREAGGTPHYFSVNLTDTEAVAKIVNTVRERSSRVDVLLHAAGLERSHFLPDKDAREFDLVFDVKADGWFNLLHAMGDMPVGATVAFSSIAGRFGNAGQTDYSSANDLLCKFTSSFRTTRPATRGIAIDWTAWGGIGMATRGSIPKMMELAGIDMLPPDAGIPLIRRELTLGGTRGEVVVGQRLGVLLNEWDPEGGVDTKAVDGTKQGPMLGKIVQMGVHSGFVVETRLDPKRQPFLFDHQIDGVPVLPGVMGMEAFAEIASYMLPGWHVAALENVELMAPFKFYRNEPRTIITEATIQPDGEDIVANCRLIGHRKLPNHTEPQATTHFTARVRLSKKAPQPVLHGTTQFASPTGAVSGAAEIYNIYFHGPAYQVLQRGWRDGNRVVGEMAASLPSNHVPQGVPTRIAPRMIELCLQTAGLWEIAIEDRFGLPHQINELRFLRDVEAATGKLYCIATPDRDAGTFDAEVVDGSGAVYLRMRGYRTAALPNAVDGSQLRAFHAVAAD